MNEDKNESGGWACGSLGERELFGEGPNQNSGGPHVCTEESMCSWCSMKEGTKVHVCRRIGGGGLAELLGPMEEKEQSCCNLCEMSEEEWVSHREMMLLDREDRRQSEEKKFLESGIALLGSLKHPGLDAHNRSIDLCIATLTDIFNSDEPNHENCVISEIMPGVLGSPVVYARSIINVFDSTRGHHEHDGERRISIEFRGKESGIRYRVELTFKKSIADGLASRINEILEVNSSYPVSDGVLRGFIKAANFLKFQVCRRDYLNNGWDYLCIDPDDSFGLWPGDSAATLLMCLHDDLTTALEPPMYTLRGGLHDASKMAFLRGASKLTIHRLMAYEMAYKRIAEATSSMPSDDVYALASRIKEEFSDPDYAREEPLAEVDYGLLQEEAWEGEWNE